MANKPQFSLRLLFVVTAAVAVLLGQAVAFPEEVAAVSGVVVMLFLPTATVAGLIYARGSCRAFWLGVFVWWLTVALTVYFVPQASDLVLVDNGRVDICIWWLLGGAGGLVAVVVRWLGMSKAANQESKQTLSSGD